MVIAVSVVSVHAQLSPVSVYEKIYHASDAGINAHTVAKSKGNKSSEGYIVLKNNISKVVQKFDYKYDIIFDVYVPADGKYTLETVVEPSDAEALKKEDKTGRMTQNVKLQIDEERPTSRILFDAHMGGRQVLGKFQLKKGQHQIKMWLPGNIRFQTIKIRSFEAPQVPQEALHYKPAIVPPKSRPRIWVNEESLVTIKNRLSSEENRPEWEKVKSAATAAFTFHINPAEEQFYNEVLEKNIEIKAFYYLMSGDKSVGKEAVHLVSDYLSVLEFGNITYGDITREIGRAIYTSAVVYDWCYDLMTAEQRAHIRRHMYRLADDMEIGWPPFYGQESIINGHGNEAQICRDLLAMSIAVYDEDPLPYQYVSYTVLEQLVPMRKFEYQSPRHNQGIDYGGYRFGWEMHAVWFYYRMTGQEVFDENIKNMPYYWLYMRTPDGKMLRDGDMFNVKYASSSNFYWKNPQTMLLCYAYSHNPLIKAEFYKQGALPDNPVLFLLLNDPLLKPDYNLNQLPKTKDFGPVLGAMVARTGWNMDRSSSDVVAEIKGGGYHFGNHQHADAGALQIYYHGIQVGDLGLYLSYGSPYDFNFNKRSVSHSMMLALDPQEKLLFRTKTNDGGTRFSQRFPRTATEAKTDPWYNVGFVRSSAVAADPMSPDFSYYNIDLTAAYTSKMSSYTRGFLFLDLNRKDVPAAIILTDDMKVNDPAFKKYWQINTLNAPKEEQGQLVLHSELEGNTGKTYVNMLLPKSEQRVVTVLSGEKANQVFGDDYEVKSNWPEARAHRIMVTPQQENREDRFLTVFQMVEGQSAPLPVQYEEKAGYYLIRLDDRIVCISKGGQLISEPIELTVPADKKYKIILAGLKEGFWTIQSGQQVSDKNIPVDPGKNVISFESQGTALRFAPGRKYGADEAGLNNN
ncbi:hypothetical protein U0038_13545 [Sphingobacterium spiritivorum]|uniref:Heparinase II/III-like protein n=1 Tax=Sphingobacterium spiritivorum ATCC 33861 TaxID=525373 RepID=D7VQL3_SPHSI|nr:hypothetical protein [Sphingobacterium spiritivorum]EFK56064.1 heparinase II/III-like protein [Sphingobacterium spiritivorum ATCC 33861]WQD32536.1 hypothetical protein U0038_13545 [Sphingobacterium spiritivorum]SUJ10871.1 Uncharacterised protein [Sphingobacterium spiritivorum]